MAKRADSGYLLPEVIDPPRRCLKIEIPNDQNHIMAFWGALQELGHAYNWKNDPDHTALDVAQVWQDVYRKAWESFLNEDCGTAEACRTYPPSFSSITYHPCSPFESGCELPAGYESAPFTVVTSGNISEIIGVWGLGYQVGDVYTDLLHLPSGDWSTILEGWRFFPRLNITTPAGSGTVKIQFLNIPQGGRALVVLDDDFNVFNPTTWRLVELNKDGLSVPPETVVPLTYELEVVGEGEHLVEIAFLPTVDDTPIPIFFGGGIRAIELCGFNFEGCNCMSEECCGDLLSSMNQNNQTLSKILDAINGGFKIVPINAALPPDAVAGGCAPFVYDIDPGDEGDDVAKRVKALCYVTHYYIINLLYRAMIESAVPIDTFAGLFPSIVNGGLPSLNRINPVWGTAWTVGAFLAAILSAGDLFNTLTCLMVEGLSGKVNTRKVFALSVPAPTDDANVSLYILQDLLHSTNQSAAAWEVFNEALVDAMTIDLSSFDCPCEISGECDELTLYNPLASTFPDQTITPVEGVPNLYRIQNPSTDTTGFGVYGASIAAVGDCCFDIEAPPPPYGLQAQTQHRVVDCNGDEGELTAGGGVPITCVQRFTWDVGSSEPIDTYFLITPHTGDPCE